MSGFKKKFKKGDRIILIDNHLAAKIGATAIVNGYDESSGYTYLNITWDKDNLSRGQQDGNYTQDRFKLHQIEDWRGEFQ